MPDGAFRILADPLSALLLAILGFVAALVYLYSLGYTTSWPTYVKGYAPNISFDYGNRAAALWLDR